MQQLKEDGEAKMAKNSPILATIDADEAHRPRAGRLARAIASDGHFLIGKVENLSHDIRFQWMGHTLNVELKDFSSDGQSDYVDSIINSEGRLYHQVLTARETKDPLVIVVLGGDTEVASAIARNVFSRGFLGAEAEDKIIEYTHMVEVFEANCEGCNIRVWRMLDNPFGRLLQKVRKILQGGDFSAFVLILPKASESLRHCPCSLEMAWARQGRRLFWRSSISHCSPKGQIPAFATARESGPSLRRPSRKH